MEKINYSAGAGELGGSLGGLPKEALSEGFVYTTPKNLSPWDEGYQHTDDNGTNSVGDRHAFGKTGACGRPSGHER